MNLFPFKGFCQITKLSLLLLALEQYYLGGGSSPNSLTSLTGLSIVVMLIRVITLSVFIATAFATGKFINPSGSDGSLTVATGDTIDISWTNTSNYDVLSLGYYSTSNATITWLISDSQSHPTSFRWTVDAAAQGFDLTASRLFVFYICKGYDFGAPFTSSYFVINNDKNAGSKTSTTDVQTSSSPTATTQSQTAQQSSTATVIYTSTASSLSSSDGSSSSSSASLSTGAKVGIAIGVIVAVLGGAVAAFFLLRRHKRHHQKVNAANAKDTHSSTPMSAHEKSYNKQPLHEDAMKYVPFSGAHEVTGSTPNVNTDRDMTSKQGATELESGRWTVERAELPGTNR